MTKIRPQDTLNHIFPEKGFFYALALVKYRCCILKMPGHGLLPVLQRILYTQISRTQACSCSAAYTVYSKYQGSDLLLFCSVYCILKKPEPGLVSARQRILVYSNFQSPGSLLFCSVYCILKKPEPGPAPARQRILYTQISRARVCSCSAAYTCILKMPGSGLVSTR